MVGFVVCLCYLILIHMFGFIRSKDFFTLPLVVRLPFIYPSPVPLHYGATVLVMSVFILTKGLKNLGLGITFEVRVCYYYFIIIVIVIFSISGRYQLRFQCNSFKEAQPYTAACHHPVLRPHHPHHHHRLPYCRPHPEEEVQGILTINILFIKIDHTIW